MRVCSRVIQKPVSIQSETGGIEMICPFCGKLGQDNHAFCLYCGAVIPRYASRPGNSAVSGDDCGSSGEATCYETYDITGYEWRSVGEPESGGMERYGTGCIPLGVHDVSDFDGAEWRSKSGPTSGETERTPLISGIIRESEFSPVLGDAGAIAANPPSSGVEEVPPPERDAAPQSEEERLLAALHGDYTILRKLGAGGMASVYLAREIALDREVAIKVLPQAHLGDEQFSARFRREAQLSAMLEHPHIVRIYRIGDEPGLCYFTMNYIPGGTISDRMRNGRVIPTRDIVRWGADVCSALAYAHDHGVIHRDLKPDNIMLDRRNHAVVTDFGIAHALREVGLTQTGAVIGTPQYMSPDQACGKPPNARSDIYSLGMVLYQMAAGILPFRSPDPVALMYMHVHQTPQPPETYNPNVPKWLQDIILRCLEKKSSDRFPDAVALRRALIEGEAGRSVRVPVRTENERGIHSIIGAAVNMVSSAVSGLWGKGAPMPPESHPAVRRQPEQTRHSLKLPRNLTHPEP